MADTKFIVPTDRFEDDVKRIRDEGLKGKLQKQIEKVAENPTFRKNIRYGLKTNRSSTKPYRFIYKVEDDRLILLWFEQRKEAYA